MKKYILLLSVILVPALLCATPSKCKKIKAQSELPLADPFVLVEGDTYYAYGTSSDRGIVVYTSTDLQQWTLKGLALDRDNTTETRWFWAPEVYHIKDIYYMYYSANEHLYVATAMSPLGPFRQVGDSPLLCTGSIDSSLFIDDDGTPYLFFVYFDNGNAIWVAQMEENLTALKYETLHPCLKVSQAWERDEKFPSSIVNEGPFVLKHDGKYVLTYSANDYQSKNYGIGIATATDIMGDWTKHDGNPVFQHEGGLAGTGHHSFFTDKTGQLQMIFHAHNGEDKIHPRLSYFVKAQWKDGGLRFDKKIRVPVLNSGMGK